MAPHPEVLIVEDNAGSRNALASLLDAAGYQSETAATLAEAMEKLDAQRVALLDLNLPDGEGVTFLRRVRRENLPIRVVVMTATQDERLLAEVRKLVPYVVLRKPLNPHGVIRTVKDILVADA